MDIIEMAMKTMNKNAYEHTQCCYASVDSAEKERKENIKCECE